MRVRLPVDPPRVFEGSGNSGRGCCVDKTRSFPNRLPFRLDDLVTRFQFPSNPVLERIRRIPLEALFWTVGLVAIASIDPTSAGGINLCLIENLGLPCPGDGLGRSIAYLARGEWALSWQMHPLGGPVVLVLGYHVTRLCTGGRATAQ